MNTDLLLRDNDYQITILWYLLKFEKNRSNILYWKGYIDELKI